LVKGASSRVRTGRKKEENQLLSILGGRSRGLNRGAKKGVKVSSWTKEKRDKSRRTLPPMYYVQRGTWRRDCFKKKEGSISKGGGSKF